MSPKVLSDFDQSEELNFSPVRLELNDSSINPNHDMNRNFKINKRKRSTRELIATIFKVLIISLTSFACGCCLGYFLQNHSLASSPLDTDTVCTFNTKVTGSLTFRVTDDSRLELIKSEKWVSSADGYFILAMFTYGDVNCKHAGKPYPFQYQTNREKPPTAIVTNITITEWTPNAVNFTLLPFDNQLVPDKNLLGRSLHIFNRETQIEKAIESGDTSKLPDPLACCVIARGSPGN